LTDEFQKKHPHIHQAAVSTLLRVKGWIVPNYPLPPNEEKTEILRVVVRESFSSSMFPLNPAVVLHSCVEKFWLTLRLVRSLC
jgi:glutamate decarboxylase